MRLSELAYVNVPAKGSPVRATRRLLRDLVCVGLMADERPSAAERVESLLGRDLTTVVRASITGPRPVHGLRTHRAA
jgi:hypothetical protein